MINIFHSYFMKTFFRSNENARERPHDLLVKSHKTVTYNDKSFKILEPKIWNSLPTETKRETSASKF